MRDRENPSVKKITVAALYFAAHLRVILALKGCRANDPLWLVAPATSLSPLSLLFFLPRPSLPPSLHPPFSCKWLPWVAGLAAGSHDWKPLMLLLFQALWCHLKEGPGPHPWSGESEPERGKEGGRRRGDSVRKRYTASKYQWMYSVVTWEIAKVYKVRKTATQMTTS